MTYHSDAYFSQNCPCKGCDKRCIGCHSDCEQYKEWKTDRDEMLAQRRLEYSSHTDKRQMPFWKLYNRQNRNSGRKV